MTKAERFFFTHAGYSYNLQTETPEQGKARCARQMAQAEDYARIHGWQAEWEQDSEPWDGEGPSPDGHGWICILRDSDGAVLASCGGIWGLGNGYKRVMEAELALEAMKPEDFPDFVPSGDVPMVTV